MTAEIAATLARIFGPGERPRFCVGLDLGRQSDFSALASLEWGEYLDTGPRPERIYNCTTLRRWPLQTPYLQVARDTAAFFQGPPCYGPPPLLAVDATGAGDAVHELIVREMARLGVRAGAVGCTITAGSAVTQSQDAPGRWRVAKKALCSTVQALMSRRRLRVAANMPETKLLLRELDSFKVKINPETANESFEAWRERDHDDLVLALALACWAGERLCPPPRRPA
jgi:hypothetical protein